MKTTEERAAEILDRFFSLPGHGMKHFDQSGFHRVLGPVIAEGLHELIEDAAQFLDKQAAGFQVLIDHAPTPIRAEDLKRVKYSIEVVAEQMRKHYGKENTHGDTRIAD